MNIRAHAGAGAFLLGAASLLGMGMATPAAAAPYALCQMQVGTITGARHFLVSLRISNCARPDDLFAVEMTKSQRTGPIATSQTSRIGTLKADAKGVASGVLQLPEGTACEVRISATNLTTGRVAGARIFIEPCDTGAPGPSSIGQLMTGARPALLPEAVENKVENAPAKLELLAAERNATPTGGMNGATASGLGVVVVAVAAGAVVSRRRNGRH